jgi:Asp-tRNA(Asn)/Glu-tRNA(Gln) amidotransferase A subunit family amidase
MSGTEPWQMEGVEVARLLRAKKLSAQEVVESQIKRINMVNSKLNAIVEQCDDEALLQAQRLDNQPGNLTNAGITMTTKINADHRGFSNSLLERVLQSSLRTTAVALSMITASFPKRKTSTTSASST